MSRDAFELKILPGMPVTLVNRLKVLRPRPMTERERNAWWSRTDEWMYLRSGRAHKWATDAVGGECDPAEVISGLR